MQIGIIGLGRMSPQVADSPRDSAFGGRVEKT